MAKPVTPQDMFDLWQKMVNPGAYPLQSLMFPVMDPAELDKKIAELETVEHWLKANLNMLQLSIKSLEYQRQMVRGGEKVKRAMQDAHTETNATASGGGKGNQAPNPAMWAWTLMQQAGVDAANAMERAGESMAKPPRKPKAKGRNPRT
jgi:hypothetical protein